MQLFGVISNLNGSRFFRSCKQSETSPGVRGEEAKWKLVTSAATPFRPHTRAQSVTKHIITFTFSRALLLLSNSFILLSSSGLMVYSLTSTPIWVAKMQLHLGPSCNRERGSAKKHKSRACRKAGCSPASQREATAADIHSYVNGNNAAQVLSSNWKQLRWGRTELRAPDEISHG